MIYFLSDAHLGSLAIERGWAHQKKVIDMLEMMSKDAVSIYMLGDMFDFWMEYFKRDRAKQEYSPFFKELRKLKREGIRVHFFTGNHDMWTFGGLGKVSGMEIHTEPCTITRYGKTLYLAHGDGLLPRNWEKLYTQDEKKMIQKYAKLKDLFNNEMAQLFFRCLPPRWGNFIGYNWAKRSRLKELANPCPYKGENKEELVLFAKDQEKQQSHRDYYIFGHRHIELDLQITDNSRVVILGDCFKQFTYAKLDHKGHLTLHNFEEERAAQKAQEEDNAQ